MYIKFVKNHSLRKNLRNLNIGWAEVHKKISPAPPPPPIAASLIIPANNILVNSRAVKNHSLGKFPSTEPPRLLNIMFPAPLIVTLLILPTKLMIYRENTAKIPVWQKSAKVYHCLYSSIEQLQVAL
jgi:hypothetical protein